MLSNANWEPYFGNNHKHIDRPTIMAMGMVSFTKHIGKPLTQDLWEDLVHRLEISDLRIYKPNEASWTDGRSCGACDVYLDDFGNVTEILFCQHWSHA